MIQGVGLHAGGPYAISTDVSTWGKSVEVAQKAEQDGLIDPLSNLENAPVYISSGSNDTNVPRMFQIFQKDFYEHFKAKLNFTETKNSHVWPVDKGNTSSKFPVDTCTIM